MNRNKIITLTAITLIFLTTGFTKLNRQTKSSHHAIAEYEVRLTHTGYTSLGGKLEDCPIRSNGKVVLSGRLKGEESGDRDDPVLYTGVLQIDIDMDICSIKRLVNGEDRFCGMRVKGNGPVEVELQTSDSSTNQETWIKIRYDSTMGNFTKSVNGDCDLAEMSEERIMVPNETIASIFNGRGLPMLTSRILQVRRYPADRDDTGNETVIEVLHKIR
ncbi:MAG TPA: hypothetical protein VIZ28_05640 [Chitinophagaceae bacterium]